MARRKTGIDLYRAAAAAERPAGGNRTTAAERPAGGNRTAAAERLPGGSRSAAPSPAGGDSVKNISGKPAKGFVKVIGEESPEPSGSRAARLLLLLGIDEAARVMASLSPEEAEAAARQIASTRRVDMVEARSLLEEFGQRFAELEVRRVRGGVDAARAILNKAFGEQKASRILAAAVPSAAPKPFAFLDDLSFPQLANLLRKENPVTLSLVMACIDPSLASRLLESLPAEDKSAVVLRMARTGRVSNKVIATVEAALQEKLRLIGRDDSEELDGRSALADILRYMDISDERRLLGDLESADPALAEEVKQKLHTMDTVLHLRSRDLQNILLEMSEREIALILKGQPPEIRERINSALSSRRRLMVADEGDLMGPVPRPEADRAVGEFLDRLRAGEEAGTFIIVREESILI